MVHVGPSGFCLPLLGSSEQTIVRGQKCGKSSKFNLGCYAETLGSLVEFVYFEPSQLDCALLLPVDGLNRKTKGTFRIERMEPEIIEELIESVTKSSCSRFYIAPK